MINTYIRTIEFEYEQVNRHWLRIHTAISVWLTAASCLLELILFFILRSLDMMSSAFPSISKNIC
ncbi:MAG: hypothetical protein LIO94_02210 [Clostridiales bacterium]|nr:hypothetical protein [Clostridiales bacterium]